MSNPKIGRFTPEGTVYPCETITGKPYSRSEYDPPPAIVHEFGGGFFAVGDVFPPRAFDVEAALASLRAEVAPPPMSPSRRHANPSDDTQEA